MHDRPRSVRVREVRKDGERRRRAEQRFLKQNGLLNLGDYESLLDFPEFEAM